MKIDAIYKEVSEMNSEQEDLIKQLENELRNRGENAVIDWEVSDSPESREFVFGVVEGVTVTVSPKGLMNISAVRRYRPPHYWTPVMAAASAAELWAEQKALDGADPKRAKEHKTGHLGPIVGFDLRCLNEKCPCNDENQEARQKREKGAYNTPTFLLEQPAAQIGSSEGASDKSPQAPAGWDRFSDWCDETLAGRVVLTPRARQSVKSPAFEDAGQAFRCLSWLATTFRTSKLEGAEGSLRDRVLESGIWNAHCGNDSFDIEWQGNKRQVEWHIKNGGDTRDPKRCLRIYYFWDELALQTVVAKMPAHIRTDLT